MSADFVMAELDCATHESCHAVAAALLGLEVVRVVADRHALIDRWGECETRFRDDDPRAPAERAVARAVVSLAAVLVAPGRGGQADSDVASAYEFARIAGAPDQQVWVDSASARARELVGSLIFRRAVGELSGELLDRGEVRGDEAAEIVARAAAPR